MGGALPRRTSSSTELRPARRAWIEQLWIAAFAIGLLPLLNLLTTDRHLGVTVSAGDWELAGVDLTAAAFGLCFAFAAWFIARREARAPRLAVALQEGGL